QAQQPNRPYAEFKLRDVTGHILAGRVVKIKIHGLPCIAAKMLQPGMTRSPRDDKHCRQKETPRKQPDKMQKPIRRKGQFVVVVRKPLSQKAQEMLVDKIEVPEAVHVSRHGMIADRMTLVRIRQPGQDVPRRGDHQKKQEARKWLVLAPAPPLAAEEH